MVSWPYVGTINRKELKPTLEYRRKIDLSFELSQSWKTIIAKRFAIKMYTNARTIFQMKNSFFENYFFFNALWIVNCFFFALSLIG